MGGDAPILVLVGRAPPPYRLIKGAFWSPPEYTLARGGARPSSLKNGRVADFCAGAAELAPAANSARFPSIGESTTGILRAPPKTENARKLGPPDRLRSTHPAHISNRRISKFLNVAASRNYV